MPTRYAKKKAHKPGKHTRSQLEKLDEMERRDRGLPPKKKKRKK